MSSRIKNLTNFCVFSVTFIPTICLFCKPMDAQRNFWVLMICLQLVFRSTCNCSYVCVVEASRQFARKGRLFMYMRCFKMVPKATWRKLGKYYPIIKLSVTKTIRKDILAAAIVIVFSPNKYKLKKKLIKINE